MKYLKIFENFQTRTNPNIRLDNRQMENYLANLEYEISPSFNITYELIMEPKIIQKLDGVSGYEQRIMIIIDPVYKETDYSDEGKEYIVIEILNNQMFMSTSALDIESFDYQNLDSNLGNEHLNNWLFNYIETILKKLGAMSNLTESLNDSKITDVEFSTSNRRFKNFFDELEYEYDYVFDLIPIPRHYGDSNFFNMKIRRDDDRYFFMSINHFNKIKITGENFIDIDFYKGDEDGDYPEGDMEDVSTRIDVRGGIDLQEVFTAIRRLLDINLPE